AAHLLGSPVERGELPVEIDREHHVVGVLKQLPKALFALAERSLAALPLCDVLQDSGHPVDLVVGADGCDREGDVTDAFVREVPPSLDVGDRLTPANALVYRAQVSLFER